MDNLEKFRGAFQLSTSITGVAGRYTVDFQNISQFESRAIIGASLAISPTVSSMARVNMTRWIDPNRSYTSAKMRVSFQNEDELERLLDYIDEKIAHRRETHILNEEDWKRVSKHFRGKNYMTFMLSENKVVLSIEPLDDFEKMLFSLAC